MIYCVVPQELADELYEKLAAYYADDPNVEVIVDRRKAERRSGGGTTDSGEARQLRDRRRQRIPGEFPKLEPDAS
jgi:hypothetical protein